MPATDTESFIANDAAQTTIVLWEWEHPDQKVSNRSFYTKVLPTIEAPPAQLVVRALSPGSYRLQVRRTGYRANDAYTAYLDMGTPKDLSTAQLQHLHGLTVDSPETDRRVKVGRDGVFRFSVPMRVNDVVLVTLSADKTR